MNKTDFNNTNDREIFIMEDLNLKVWIQWNEWSLCSKCDTIGKKTKFGHCMISLNGMGIIKKMYRTLNVKF